MELWLVRIQDGKLYFQEKEKKTMEKKTLSELILELQRKIVDALNESGLAPEILELILNNIVLSIHKAPPTSLDTKEVNDG